MRFQLISIIITAVAPLLLAAVTRRLEAVADFLFGYDFFISYAHADGKEYPRLLRRRLEELGYKTFLDEEGFVGGDDLNRATRRRVRMSSKLVLLARPHALTISPWVRQELSAFVERGGSPVVVNFDGAVEALPPDSPIRSLLQGRLWFPESSTGAEDARPSDRIVHEIVRTFDSTRQETLRLRILAVAALVFFATAAFAGWQWLNAELRRRVSVAARLDAEAGRHFAEAAAAATAWDRESARREDLHREIARWTAAPAPERAGVLEARLANLRQEVDEATWTMTELALEARTRRDLGRRRLGEADEAWRAASSLWKRSGDRRVPPASPQLFSIEVLSVGFGESLILHYGDPDAPGFILIDGGRPQTYAKALKPRLAALRRTWAPQGPLPLDYVMISNQDNDRLGGIERLLRELRNEADRAVVPLVQIENVWFESFGPGYSGWQKALARLHIETLGIPLNKPFDGVVMRPQQGRVMVDLGHGLTVTVLNPGFEDVRKLHRLWDKEAEKRGEERPRAPVESYGTAHLSKDVAGGPPLRAAGCQDRSVPNRASLVLLFSLGGRTFLHGGDACGAQIEAGLRAAGLLGADGTASVDLMLVPHQGSDRNVSLDFFRRIKARHYLFTGDGTHNNPEEATLGMILEARRGEAYGLQFVNRDGRPGFGEKLDAFFASRPSSVYGYRRVFRSGGNAAITVDLLDRVRY